MTVTIVEAMGQDCEIRNVAHEAITAYVMSGWTILSANWQGYTVASPTREPNGN